MTTVAVVVFSLDGTKHLTECLRSVRWADNILVLHAGDEPSLLAADLDPPPTVRKWIIGSKSTEWESEIGTDWVLHLWEEERVEARLCEELKALRKKNLAETASQYSVRIRSLLLGGWVEGSLCGPTPAPRLRRRLGSISGGWRPERADPRGVTKLLEGWENFYRHLYTDFGIRSLPDFSKLQFSKEYGSSDYLVVVAQGLTTQNLFEMCCRYGEKTYSSVRKWVDYDLDEVVTSDRSAEDATYGVWVRDELTLREKIAEKGFVEERSSSGITLKERLLCELRYLKGDDHFNLGLATYCKGSRVKGYETGGTICVQRRRGSLVISPFVSMAHIDNVQAPLVVA